MPAFEWKDYLDLARELATRSDEGCKRTAFSRAYYAAYRTAHDWYEHRYPGTFPPGGHNSHAVVWAAFQSSTHSGDWRYGRIGTLGNRLKGRRVDADYYRPLKQRTAIKLNDTLMEAEEIITILSGM